MYLVISNIIVLIASFIMIYSGFIENKNKIIIFQTVQIGLTSISDILIGGYTGFLINILCCYRNILCYKNRLNLFYKIFIGVMSFILTILFNNNGFIGLLPFTSMLLFLLFMNTKKVLFLKVIIIFSMFMWFIYDFYIGLYVASFFDILSVCSNLISIKKCLMK